jgi:hypothetical protein
VKNLGNYTVLKIGKKERSEVLGMYMPRTCKIEMERDGSCFY